jgi:hypothetical protein
LAQYSPKSGSTELKELWKTLSGDFRRILSPVFLVLHGVANFRIYSHKAFVMNTCMPSFQLHRIAQECTEIDNEQPLKQPPKIAETSWTLDALHSKFCVNSLCRIFHRVKVTIFVQGIDGKPVVR